MLGNKRALGHHVSEEARLVMSKSKQGKQPWLGKHHSEESKQRMRMAQSNRPGCHHTEESKQKIREGRLGCRHSALTKRLMSENRKGEGNPRFGVHVSDETKLKLKLAVSGFKHTEVTKQIMREKRANLVIPLEDTSIEKKVQAHLNNLQVPYMKHVQIPGLLHKPLSHHRFDLILDNKIIIEVNGCYWHSCTICHLDLKEKNKKYTERDRALKQLAEAAGYTVIWIWEHNINKGDFSAIDNVLASKGLLNEPVPCDAMELPIEIITQ